MTERPPPDAGRPRRPLSPVALGAALVLGLIALLCAVGPLVWPVSSATTHLSLGATPPLATILELETTGDERLLDLPRADRLAGNGNRALGDVLPGRAPLEPAPGETITWVQVPPVLPGPEGYPVPPAWVRPGEGDAYLAAVAPHLEPDPGWQQTWKVGSSPLRFLLGTDELGRDLAVRILEGGRLSLAVGLAATLVSVTIGLLYGGIAGYAGGRVDTLLMRIVDVLYSLPFLLFVILLMVVFPRSLLLLFLAIGAVEWLTTARIVRGEILARKRLPYVLAARALGLGHGTILLRHLLPNTLGPVLVYATLTVPTVILLESVLSFLGLGVQPPASSWGILINEGAERMLAYPWMLVGPSLLFALTLLSLNLLGDGLRDRLDPRARFRLRR